MGRRLEPEDAERARELDRARDLVAALANRRDLRPSLANLRPLQQGLILTSSVDPERRGQAMQLPELAERAPPVYEGWKVPTEQQNG